MTISNDWTDLAVDYTQDRMKYALQKAMEEPQDARRVLTYLRGVGAGKFAPGQLAKLLEVDYRVVRTVAETMEFEMYHDDDNCRWYIFNADHFKQVEVPDLGSDALESEIADLKAQIKSLQATIRTADSDHAETLQKYERLRIYVAAARDVLNDADRRPFILPGLIVAVSHLLSLGSNTTWRDFLIDAVSPYPEVPEEDDDDDDDDLLDDGYDEETDWYN
jgi:hypothetical protein